MKFMKRLLYGLLGLLSLISLFIILCGFWPQLADNVSDFLYDKLGNSSPARESAYDKEEMPDTPAVSGEDAGRGSVRTGMGEDIPASIGGASDTAETGGMKLAKDENDVSGYVPPERADISTPEEVSGRGGYTPVQDNAEQIGEEEAKELQKQYTYGETGEGLDFDTEFYPYYGMLSEKEKSLYRQIYANSEAVNGIFNPVVSVSQTELRNTFMAVFNDHPELFWLDPAYRGKFTGRGECAEIALQFNALVDNLDRAKMDFNAAAEGILAEAGNLGSDYEKEVYIHNLLLNRITYDLRSSFNQSAYSALVNGRTVCAGYARSFQYLMTMLGVPCYYCTGYAGENHAWNIIRLDGEYYNADATWDDTEPNTYDYFNKTDNEFMPTHRREDLSVYLPACNGTAYGNLERVETEEEIVPDGRRSLEDAGFSEEDVLFGIEEYYDDCYRQIMDANGSAQFENIVDSEQLWLQCYQAYEDDSYSAGYMNQVLEQLQAGGCEVDVEAESLRDGRVLLHHSIRFF